MITKPGRFIRECTAALVGLLPLAAVPVISGCTTTPQQVEANDNSALPTPEEYKKDFLDTLRATLKSEIAKISDEDLQTILDKIDIWNASSQKWGFSEDIIWPVGDKYTVSSGAIEVNGINTWAQISVLSNTETELNDIKVSLSPLQEKMKVPKEFGTNQEVFEVCYLPSKQEVSAACMDVFDQVILDRPALSFDNAPIVFLAMIPFVREIFEERFGFIVNGALNEMKYFDPTQYFMDNNDRRWFSEEVANTITREEWEAMRVAPKRNTDGRLISGNDLLSSVRAKAGREALEDAEKAIDKFGEMILRQRELQSAPSPNAEEVKEVPKEEQKQRQ